MLWWANLSIFISGLVNIEQGVKGGSEEMSIQAVIEPKDIQSAKTFKATAGTQEIKCDSEVSRVSYFC